VLCLIFIRLGAAGWPCSQRSTAVKDAELLVLRHEVAVPRRAEPETEAGLGRPGWCSDTAAIKSATLPRTTPSSASLNNQLNRPLNGHTAPVVHGLQVLAFTAPGATLFPQYIGDVFILVG
jgi:hypothetical protein